jgi:hypothetical protein
MAPGVGPAQSAGHDVGSVQPLDESLSLADADSHSLNKRKIDARHGLSLGRSRMRERRKSGSVRGAGSNLRPYSTFFANKAGAWWRRPKAEAGDRRLSLCRPIRRTTFLPVSKRIWEIVVSAVLSTAALRRLTCALAPRIDLRPCTDIAETVLGQIAEKRQEGLSHDAGALLEVPVEA